MSAKPDLIRCQICGYVDDEKIARFERKVAKLQRHIGRLENALMVYLQAGSKDARREASVIAKAALSKGAEL